MLPVFRLLYFKQIEAVLFRLDFLILELYHFQFIILIFINFLFTFHFSFTINFLTLNLF